jgi:glycosyltransferase involved in cell wall biosynthesis
VDSNFIERRGKLRLAVLASHPIQYQAPLYRQLAQHPQIELTVYYCSDQGISPKKIDPGFGLAFAWDISLLEGYRYRFLPNYSPKPSPSNFWGTINPGLFLEVYRKRFDALLVHGWYGLTNLFAFLTAWVTKTPLLIRGESSLLNERPDWRSSLKSIILPLIFKHTAAFLTIGRLNEAFYRSHGVPQEQLFLTPYAVDNDFFKGLATGASSKAEFLRQELKLPTGLPVILYVGKLVPWKEPLLLLQGFAPLDGKAALVFVGDGVERPRLEHMVRHSGLHHVRLIGFRNQTELPAYYALGDIFVLPSSYEPWGLVINEAMNFGLPIITTNKVGAHADLVEPGGNGFIVPARDKSALEVALTNLVSNGELRVKYGHRSLEIIDGWNFDTCVKSIERALSCLGPRTS